MTGEGWKEHLDKRRAYAAEYCLSAAIQLPNLLEIAGTLTTGLWSYASLQIGYQCGCNVPVDTDSSLVSHLVYKSLVLGRYRLSSLLLTESVSHSASLVASLLIFYALLWLHR
jgi:hypothetical protein